MSVKTLAIGFKGPADFWVFPVADGLRVIVPYLAKSELRVIKISE